LSSTNTEAGGSGFALTVFGENFGNNAVVRWNNSDRPTTLVSSTQLSATISAADIAAAGTSVVTVSSAGGNSNGVTFTINPKLILPTISGLQPASVDAGSAAFTLTVNGNNFVSSSTVRWNGANRPTTMISAQQLTATISSADVASTGTVSITVSNPDGVSSASTFTIAPPSLVLFTEPNSDRAIALDSVMLLRDPFAISSPLSLAQDQRTRVVFFSSNLVLMPGDLVSSVFAEAEDSQHHVFPVVVEFVGKVPQYDSLTEIVIRLPDQVGTANALWLRIQYRGTVSNKVMFSLR